MKCLTKKSKSIKRHVKSFLFKYTASFVFIISYILYYLSLEKCFDGEELCGNNMKWIYKKLFELILSCELISLLIATIIFNYTSKFHLIHLIIIFLFSKSVIFKLGYPEYTSPYFLINKDKIV